MPLIRTSSPAAEPMDLAEAKLQLRYDDSTADALIAGAIQAVRAQAETLTRKQLVICSWKQVMDAFPCYSATGNFWHRRAHPRNAITLERGPVTRVLSIQYLDMSRTIQTVDPATYTVDYASDPVRITPVFGTIWPIPLPEIGSVWVNFEAGYAAPAVAVLPNIQILGMQPLAVGAVVRFSNSGGALPSPLQPNTDYTISAVVSPGVYTLQGAAITAAGTGTSYVYAIPEGIKSWMKIRMATLDLSRDDPMLAQLTEVGLDFVDRILDAYRTPEL